MGVLDDIDVGDDGDDGDEKSFDERERELRAWEIELNERERELH